MLRLANRSADILFIAVDPRGVDVPVPNVQGMPNDIPGLAPCELAASP